MNPLRILLVTTFAAAATACAGPGAITVPTPAPEAAAHQAEPAASAPIPAIDPRMKAMQAMHEKMMNAKTPAERQALMAGHMKAMQDGMAMMQEMGGMPGRGAKDMQAGMADHHQAMERRMAMMQMMMTMMMDRQPAPPP